MAERKLNNLGYFKCADYTIPEGEHVRVFKYLVTEEFRCYYVLRLPDYALNGEYYLNESYARTYVTVPPETEYLSMGGGGKTLIINVNEESSFDPREGGYVFGSSQGFKPLGYPFISFTTSKEHVIFYYAMKPITKGVTYNITIVIKTELIRGTPPPPESAKNPYDIPIPIYRQQPTLAQRLNITDINDLMAYLGFQKCGEYYLEPGDNLTVSIPVDPNNGTACYILIYPKDKNMWLKGFVNGRWHWNLTGDIPERWNGSFQADTIQGLLTGNPQNPNIVNPLRAYSQEYDAGDFGGLGFPTAGPGDGFVFAFSLRKPEGFPTINGTLVLEIRFLARTW